MGVKLLDSSMEAVFGGAAYSAIEETFRMMEVAESVIKDAVEHEEDEERMKLAGVVFYRALENKQPGHFKRWEVMVVKRDGGAVEVRRWGRIGNEPSVKEFKHGSVAAALEVAEKKAEEKLRNGYEAVG